jgi:hypothetical protein
MLPAFPGRFTAVRKQPHLCSLLTLKYATALTDNMIKDATCASWKYTDVFKQPPIKPGLSIADEIRRILLAAYSPLLFTSTTDVTTFVTTDAFCALVWPQP